MVRDKKFARTRARYTSWLGNILMTYFAISCINYLCVCPHLLLGVHTHTHTRINACRNSSCGTLHNSICVINWQLTGAAIKISGHKIQLWPQQVHKQNTHTHIHIPAHAHIPHKIDTHPTHTYTRTNSFLAPSSIRNQCNQLCMHPCGRHAALRCSSAGSPASLLLPLAILLALLPVILQMACWLANATAHSTHTHTYRTHTQSDTCKATIWFV